MTNYFRKSVLVTGGFDPLHSGHIKYFLEASKISKRLVVGINSDEWLKRKKGFAFQKLEERKFIIENLKMVECVKVWNDSDDTANNLIIELIKELDNDEILIFANGGDRKNNNTPEAEKFKDNNKIKFVYGIGGFEKINSSSIILENYITSKLTEKKV